MDTNLYTNPVILFDGVCNLCNGSVQKIIAADPKRQFRFASLQGEFGQQVLKQFHLAPGELSSFILLENNQIFIKSTGALKVARKLSGAWPLLYALILVPRFIRDGVYNTIARNRYKWFGKKESCMVPHAALQNLFYP